MRKTLILVIVVWSLLLISCGSGDLKGYKKTSDGLYYRFEQQNMNEQQVQEGDGLVGDLIIRLDSVQVFHDNGSLMRATRDGVSGLFYEGFMMMHKGDRATFVISADTMAKYMEAEAPGYIPNAGQKMYIEIYLKDIVTKKQIEEEKARAEQLERERRERESQINGMWKHERIDYSTYDIIQETLTFQGGQYKYKAETSGGRGWGGQWIDYTRRGNEIYVDGEVLFTIEPNGDLKRKSDGEVFGKMY